MVGDRERRETYFAGTFWQIGKAFAEEKCQSPIGTGIDVFDNRVIGGGQT
jgi:hypothetical protein